MKIDVTTILLTILVVIFALLAIFFIKNTNTDMERCVNDPIKYTMTILDDLAEDKITCTCSGARTKMFFLGQDQIS